MLLIGGSILPAWSVLAAPWGLVLVSCVMMWEIAEKVFLLRSTERIPVAVGREAMIGLQVTVLSACQPEGGRSAARRALAGTLLTRGGRGLEHPVPTRVVGE